MIAVVFLAAAALAVAGLVFWHARHKGVSLKAGGGPGFSIRYPSQWVVSSLSSPSDVVFLARDPHPNGPIVPGLIMRRTRMDTTPIDQDLLGVTMANQFEYGDTTVLTNHHVTVRGAKEAVVVVSSATISGVAVRIVDIVARTGSDIAYHLQAVAPAPELASGTVDALVAGLLV